MSFEPSVQNISQIIYTAKIKVLDKHLAKLTATGEVAEKPDSAIKKLWARCFQSCLKQHSVLFVTGKIKVLDKQFAELIAAGEVVERQGSTLGGL